MFSFKSLNVLVQFWLFISEVKVKQLLGFGIGKTFFIGSSFGIKIVSILAVKGLDAACLYLVFRTSQECSYLRSLSTLAVFIHFSESVFGNLLLCLLKK